MLTIDEYNSLCNDLNNKFKNINKNVLATIKNYVVGVNANTNPFLSTRGTSCINKVYKNPSDNVVDPTRRKEKERGFKVRSVIESEKGEAKR
jgi:hypothetical protein